MGANKKISGLTGSGAIVGTEELPIVQSGSTVKTTINAIKTFLESVFVKKGTLTTNYIPKATASDTIGDSGTLDDGINGIQVQTYIKNINNTNNYVELNYNSGSALRSNAEAHLLAPICQMASASDHYARLESTGRKVLLRGDLLSFYQSSNAVGVVFDLEHGTGGNINDTIAYFYSASGNTYLGIGKTVPAEALDVVGNVVISGLTASQIVETDSNKKLISAAKGTAYNKDFGTGTTNVVEIGSTLGNTKPLITSSSGKLQTSDWVDIVSSCTFVGWSSYTTQEVDVIDMGAYYMLHINVTGTSNSATTTIQLPYTTLNTNNGAGLFSNNGTTIIGRWIFSNGSNTITFGTSAISSVWTASGTKSVGIDIFFKK